MTKEELNWRLTVIMEQLTHQQIIHARRNRNWYKFDRLNELQKLQYRFEEFEIYSDIIDINYKPVIKSLL